VHHNIGLSLEEAQRGVAACLNNVRGPLNAEAAAWVLAQIEELTARLTGPNDASP